MTAVLPAFQGEAYINVFTPEEVSFLNHAWNMVLKAPYELDGKVVRCHELSRAVAQVLGLTVEDGYYGMAEHSWIWLTPREPFSPLPRILDVYVPGRMPQVQLIDPHLHLPFEYRRGPERTDIDEAMVQELVRLIVQV